MPYWYTDDYWTCITQTNFVSDALFSYCVTFELTKVSKACHKEKVFSTLHDGNSIIFTEKLFRLTRAAHPSICIHVRLRCRDLRPVWTRGHSQLPGRPLQRTWSARKDHPLDFTNERRMPRQMAPASGWISRIFQLDLLLLWRRPHDFRLNEHLKKKKKISLNFVILPHLIISHFFSTKAYNRPSFSRFAFFFLRMGYKTENVRKSAKKNYFKKPIHPSLMWVWKYTERDISIEMRAVSLQHFTVRGVSLPCCRHDKRFVAGWLRSTWEKEPVDSHHQAI